MVLGSIVLVLVDVVLDQIGQVFAHVAVGLEDRQVLGMVLQGEHQQPQGCLRIGMHCFRSAGVHCCQR